MSDGSLSRVNSGCINEVNIMLFLMQIMTHVWNFVIKFVNVNGVKLMLTTCSVTAAWQLVATYSTQHLCSHQKHTHTHTTHIERVKLQNMFDEINFGLFFLTLSSVFMFAEIPSVVMCLHINGIIHASHLLGCHFCHWRWWSILLILQWNLIKQ